MMNILVTGSNGFIGSHLCRYLKNKGNYMIGLGRRKSAVSQVDEYISCDMDSDKTAFLYEYMQAGHLDAVVHLAADMRKEPYGIEVVSHNCTGTQRILELCRQKGIRTFIQLSSLPVIGKPILHPVTEAHPLAPPTIYHVTKVAEELLADYAYRKHGLRTVSLRISAPVGTGMNPGTIFPTFVRNAMRGEALALMGKGTRKQTYVHVRDIAQAVWLALENEKANGVYNLSSNNCLSNRELAQTCIELLHSPSKIIFSGKEDSMDDDRWDVSIERIQQELAYVPEVSVEEAVLEYADFLRCSKQA